MSLTYLKNKEREWMMIVVCQEYEYLKQVNMHHHDKRSIKTKGLEGNLLHEHSSSCEDALGFKETYAIIFET